MNEKLVELHRKSLQELADGHNKAGSEGIDGWEIVVHAKRAAEITESLMQEWDEWRKRKLITYDLHHKKYREYDSKNQNELKSFSDLFAEFMNQYKTKTK